MADEFTGSDAASKITEPGKQGTAIQTPARTTKPSSGSAMSGEQYTSTIATVEQTSTGTTSRPVSRRGSTLPRDRVVPRTLHRSKAILDACIEDLNRAIESDGEFFARNNALEQLKAKLADLWSIRTDREEAFHELVNMLQAVFAKRRVEDFTETQLVSLRSAFEEFRAQSLLDDQIVNSITQLLLEGGVDVFREIE